MKNRIALLFLWQLCVIAGVVSSLQMLWSVLVGSPKAWRLAKAFDRVGNAATGGSDKETVSSRANQARLEGRRWGCLLCKILDRFEKDHCSKSAGV